MPTDGFQVLGRCRVQQQSNSLADRLVAAEFIEKLNDEIGVERRIKLVHHLIPPPAPLQGLHGPFSFIKAQRRLSQAGCRRIPKSASAVELEKAAGVARCTPQER
jgi:hypothetical protein